MSTRAKKNGKGISDFRLFRDIHTPNESVRSDSIASDRNRQWTFALGSGPFAFIYQRNPLKFLFPIKGTAYAKK
jgi:hypothetical protein